MTLYGGLLFISEEERGNSFIEFVAFLLIVFVNLKFLLLWMFMILEKQHKYKVIKIILTVMRLVLMKKHADKGNIIFQFIVCINQYREQ